MRPLEAILVRGAVPADAGAERGNPSTIESR
jgi:hypothetical protein